MHPDIIVVLNSAEYAILLRFEESEGRLEESELADQSPEVDVLIEHGLLKRVGGYDLLTTRGTLFLTNRNIAGDLFWAALVADDSGTPHLPK